MAPLLEVGGLIRLRSITLDEWLISCPEEGFDDSIHNVYTLDRKYLPDKYAGTDSVFWQNTGFIVREAGAADAESDQQLVRLDASRYENSFLFVAPDDKASGKARAYVRSRETLEAKDKWQYTVFAVESEPDDASRIRLRSTGVPDSYLVASADDVYKQEFLTAAAQNRHKVFAMPAGDRAGPLWDASAFEVVQEGVEAAKAQELEAKEDAKLNKKYVKHFGDVVMASVGVTALAVVMNAECPAVPGLKPVIQVLAIVGFVEPFLGMALVCATAVEQRTTGKMPLWARALDLLFKLVGGSLAVVAVAIAAPKGYFAYNVTQPKTRAEAVALWNATNFNASEFASGGSPDANTPPPDLPFCDDEIVGTTFWGGLFVLVFGGAALLFFGGIACLEGLDALDKADKAAKEKKAAGAVQYDAAPAAPAEIALS